MLVRGERPCIKVTYLVVDFDGKTKIAVNVSRASKRVMRNICHVDTTTLDVIVSVRVVRAVYPCIRSVVDVVTREERCVL